ncbi:MAG: (Fe-S)-binding protein [Pseudomonadota bacterium]
METRGRSGDDPESSRDILNTRRAPAASKDYSACSGCNLCLLVCPVWRRTRDLSMTPRGRAKALQHGAGAADIADSIQSCSLCAACMPVCPEEIDLVAMTLDLRSQLAQPAPVHDMFARMNTAPAPIPFAGTVLLPGLALRASAGMLARVAALLGGARAVPVHDDDGADIALALEAGAAIPAQRVERFLAPLRRRDKIIVADGLLLYQLYRWLPRSKLISLGEALSRLPQVRRGLCASDLYVIEARAYHFDYQRLVKYYDGLRRERGCSMNLDLQRIAIPAAAPGLRQKLGLETAGDDGQARWILQGRNCTRVVVESVEERAAFERVGGLAVVHLADLADDGTS